MQQVSSIIVELYVFRNLNNEEILIDKINKSIKDAIQRLTAKLKQNFNPCKSTYKDSHEKN